jgi:uncharacterized repeat protein (TIGR01451 family)
MTRKLTLLLLAAFVLLGAIAPGGAAAFAADGADNYPLNSIVIKIEDIVTHQMLGGARFEIYYNNQAVSGGYGTLVATADTDGSGVIVLSGIPGGYYIVRQTVPPNNYQLSVNNEQHCYIKPDGTSIEELVFSNYRYGGLVVLLTDKDTGAPIAGATFSVTDVNNSAVGNSADGVYETDARGEFFLENLPAGDYKITQLTAARGYAMDSSPNMRTVRLQHTNADQSVYRATFSNSPLGTLLVRVKDSISKEPLAGATFNVKLSGGADLGEYTTSASGSFMLPKIPRGTYVIEQVSAPAGYLKAATKTQYVNYINTYAADFENQPKSGLYVTKYDAETKDPLANAKFHVYIGAELIGTYTTNADGVFYIVNLEPGQYTVSEFQAPSGYILDDTPQSVALTSEQLHRLEFANSKLASLQVIKTDEYNGEPLANAKFRVTAQSGEYVADLTTDGSGKAIIPAIAPGWYVISETKAPAGYLITEAARTVEVKATVPTVVTITNRAENNLEIVKLDCFTRTPLAGATFKVEHANGANVGTYNTDSAGKILIGSLAEDAYVVSEIKAPQGYMLDSEPQVITIEGGRLHSLEFLDKPLSGIEILKTDASAHAPLANATFKVTRANGEVIGTYKTDVSGKALVTGLESGTYIVSETVAPDGYILDAAPQTVIVNSGALTVAEFENKPLAGLKIIKLDSVSRAKVGGAEFNISRLDGAKVENDLSGFTFRTDATGEIFIPQLADGYYVVTETKAADGYVPDPEPKTVLVQSGKTTLLEVFNTPMSGLLIVKTDETTKKPLAGVKFEVKKPSGEQIGAFTTDQSGQIRLTDVPAGTLIVTETAAIAGYEIDETAREVTVFEGKQTTLEITNRSRAGFRLLKIDSVTKRPIYGVEFMIFDAAGNQVGTFVTDNNGTIDFAGILTEGRYTVRETKPADGYYRDDMPRTIEFVSGKVTEIVWENTPQAGQIHITKLSGDDNEQSGLPKGSPLAGAVFEIYEHKSGNLVDRFVSGADGRAVSNPLPLGRYTVKEVEAPQHYKLSAESLDIEVEFATQIIKREFLNYSANTGVKIRKTGVYETMPGDTIRYDIKEVANTSSVPLTDFYLRDVLPTDAVRLQKIVTGTYSQSLKYKILVTTNKGDTRIIADNLSTTQSNVVDCRGVALGLASDEYIIGFTLVFGTVKAGFCQVTAPQVYVTVNKNLPTGYEFANKADAGGKDPGRGEWIVGNAVWVTSVYAPPSKLPRTGY